MTSKTFSSGELSMQAVESALQKYWGYREYLPLQRDAIQSVIAGRDSVVVLPTGGGKSICFQAPALVLPGLAVVVSPLISLMKDQVDALTECGVPAARIDSSISYGESEGILSRIRNRSIRILYVAPERLVTERFINVLRGANLSFIAVDEAHCVSMWGHDFRPEYRQLSIVKEMFPGIAVHAYTATATSLVRDDIVKQLGLANPEILVGSFDRPNLVYKVERRERDKVAQVRAILDRHKGESGIVYCIRRADVDGMCAELRANGYRAAPYHAGLEDRERQRSQDAFSEEKVDTIVATVAFGMGIDKSNVRYVIHAGAPKSLEHYQQESGRAGRDGLEAECCLLYSGSDFNIWRRFAKEMEPEASEIALRQIRAMDNYCTGITCRHAAILDYFGQDLGKDNCLACDVCLGTVELMENPLETAQKILSCIVRLQEGFGGDYTSAVLVGSREQRFLDAGHDRLSTYGILKDYAKPLIRKWIEQLISQGCIEKTGDYNILTLTARGWGVIKGLETPRLAKPPDKKSRNKMERLRVSYAEKQSWEGVDKGLFESLRELRHRIAEEKNVPAFVVFSDSTLRDMARRRPSTPKTFLEVNGVGDKKNEDYGTIFLSEIARYCRMSSLAMDVEWAPS